MLLAGVIGAAVWALRSRLVGLVCQSPKRFGLCHPAAACDVFDQTAEERMLLRLRLPITHDHPLFQDIRDYLNVNAPSGYMILIERRGCTVYLRSASEHRQFAGMWEALAGLSDAAAGSVR